MIDPWTTLKYWSSFDPNVIHFEVLDNKESWEVSYFDAKDHIFQTRGVRF
jgi:hypothetical protein